MTDKVQKIREELARLKEETSIGLSEHDNGVEQGRMEIIDALSLFLDSMQKEPASEDFEEALTREWQGYNDRGAATVDALEDNTQELAFSKGFYRGSNWQKNHIWHDANERPKKSGVKTAWITNDKVFYSGWYNKSAFGHEDMRDSITKFEFDKIRKWCYLDDLLNTD